MAGGESKTEKATPKKRRDERKEGHVPMSKDVVTIVSLLAGFVSLQLLFPFIYRSVRTYLMNRTIDLSRVDDLNMASKKLLTESIVLVAETCLPLLLIAVAAAVIGTGAQTKFLVSGKNLKPKMNRLNPISGLKNILSLKSLVELLKNLLKVMVLVYLLYRIIQDDLNMIIRTIDMDLTIAAGYTLSAIMSMVYKVAMAFTVIAGLDILYQIWNYEKEIRMSKEEMKEEFKQTEGNPEIKSRIRNIQRQRAQSRMMQQVPEADVIIRNPTHFAVALRYNIDRDNAPVLLAKGADEIALRIVKVGEEHGVSVVENPVLARAIYAQTPIGREIPEEYYGMVAELLVYVYQLKHVSLPEE